jgi:DNA-binding NarL/FixJ family response regulator
VIRVCLVEDQTLVRQGIKSLLALAEDIEVVAEAVDGEDALRVIPSARADVVLLDVRMPKKNGLQVLEALTAGGALPPTIILTTFDDDQVVLDGVKAGAKGFLLKDVSLEELTGAIRSVAAGETLIRFTAADRILAGLRDKPRVPSTDLPETLTERETEVLQLLAGGYSNREIAGALHVAEGTVKNHTSSILSKLGVRDRTRAVLKALERGLI